MFIKYYFPDTAKVAVPTKFFIGWRQLDQERLNLGLDRNIDHSDKIKFSVDGGGTWLTSPFAGSAMMRPIFSTSLDPTLGIASIQQEQTFLCFPNPATHEIQFKSALNLEGVEKSIFDGAGRLIAQTNQQTLSVEHFQAGLYFVLIPSISSTPVKFIKQ